MHKLLILGNSNIVRRRVLPAAQNIFESIDLGTRRPEAEFQTSKKGQVFSDYAEALKKSNASHVYVSLTNNLHDLWVRQALELGKNVIVDKPAFMDLDTAYELTNLADKKGLLLAEATVYSYHPQVHAIKNLFQEKASAPTRLFAQFSVPPFTKDNFRYDKNLGGGALLDMGPYAASVGRIFFNEAPKDVQCRILSKNQVETAFSVMCTYKDSRSFVGTFGFDTEYSNHIRVLSSNTLVTTDRFFTTNSDQVQNISFKNNNQDGQITVPAADSFSEFLRWAVKAEVPEKKTFMSDLIADAELVDRMRKSALKEIL